MIKDTQKPSQIYATELTQAKGQYTIDSWKPEEAGNLFLELEQPNWAPWLAASEQTIAQRVRVFPAGQLVMKDLAGGYLGSLSLNQTHWDGIVHHLPSWDEVAGDPTDYSKTYKPDGNTLVLLSMNVAPLWKGKQIPSKLIDQAAELAYKLGITNLIGSFRPSGFGGIKQGLGYNLDFEEYCMMKRHNTTKPVDPWLGSLWHKGMQMLAVDPKAMVVQVPIEEFEGYKTVYNQGKWVEIKPNIWECGEVGSWTVDETTGIATYQESNMWGKLPLK